MLDPARSTVVQIFGLWYSGTSLLNLLLNSQPGVRGLGEAHHLYDGVNADNFCSCGRSLRACGFYNTVDPLHFYEQCFALYQCSVLIDSSKEASLFEAVRCQYPRRLSVLLSKHPHAWVYSAMQHHPERAKTVTSYFQDYIEFYQYHLDLLSVCVGFQPPITYQAMVDDPSGTVRGLCRALPVTFHQERLNEWWKTDTHIVSGNASVYFQVQSHTRFFQSDSKYQGKEHCIFLDEAWRKDDAFKQACIDAYRQHIVALDALLPILGHEKVEAQLAPLHAPSTLPAFA